jgi:hypothetical protein
MSAIASEIFIPIIAILQGKPLMIVFYTIVDCGNVGRGCFFLFAFLLYYCVSLSTPVCQ